MDRTRVLKPGSSLAAVNGPKYYDITELYVGASLEILCRQFLLIDADEFVYNFMELEPKKFTKSNPVAIKEKFAGLFSSLNQEKKQSFRDSLEKADLQKAGVIGREALIDLAKSVFSSVTDHELVTFSRLFETSPKIVEYAKIAKIFT
jgi:EF-hand domain-containing protein 1